MMPCPKCGCEIDEMADCCPGCLAAVDWRKASTMALLGLRYEPEPKPTPKHTPSAESMAIAQAIAAELCLTGNDAAIMARFIDRQTKLPALLADNQRLREACKQAQLEITGIYEKMLPRLEQLGVDCAVFKINENQSLQILRKALSAVEKP